MLLNITVDELDVLSVSVGQSVSVYLDALSGTHFAGTVTEIDYEGVNSGGNTKYTVTVALARTGSMLPGMNGTVVISGETHVNTLLIPVAALYETGNSVVVYRGYDPETDELLDPVPVTTGFSDGTNAEILSGLSAGDVFWYRYADTVFYATGTTEQ